MNDDNQEDSDKMKTLTAEVRRIRKNVVGMCVCVCVARRHTHTRCIERMYWKESLSPVDVVAMVTTDTSLSEQLSGLTKNASHVRINRAATPSGLQCASRHI